MMKLKILMYPILLFSFLLLSSNASETTANDGDENKTEDQYRYNELIKQMIQQLSARHYSPHSIDDDFSAKVFDLYIENLDRNKRFFIQNDYDELVKYRDKIDDEINSASADLLEKSIQIIEERVTETAAFYKDLLAEPFDFSIDENVEFDPDKIEFVGEKEELKERWRKWLKYQTLTRLAEALEEQEKAKEEEAEKRAKIVYDYLLREGIETERLTFKGYGESKLLDLENNKNANDRNRRIEFKVTGINLEIQFRKNQYEVPKEAMEQLLFIVELLNANSDHKIIVEGHTDSSGDLRFNQNLSNLRAKSVYEFITKRGVNKERVSYAGFGISQPRYSNETPKHVGVEKHYFRHVLSRILEETRVIQCNKSHKKIKLITIRSHLTI